jgi:hypothetical protein
VRRLFDRSGDSAGVGGVGDIRVACMGGVGVGDIRVEGGACSCSAAVII